MKKETLGTLLAVVTAIISGVSIFANKFFIVKLDPIVFTAVRAIIIGAVFLVLSLCFHSWKDVKRSKTHWGYLLFIGVIGGGLAFLLFFSGLKLTTAGRAAFLNKTLPIYATVFAFAFLKEKITKKQFLALVLMLIGLVVLVAGQIAPTELWSNPGLGDLLVIGATVLWAIEYVVAKKAMIEGEHNFVVSFARMFFGAILLWGVVILTGRMNLILALTVQDWLNILVSTGFLLLYVLTFYWSMKKINVSKASTILLLAPVITLILGMIFLKEPIETLQLVGSALILVGAYFAVSVTSEFARI